MKIPFNMFAHSTQVPQQYFAFAKRIYSIISKRKNIYAKIDRLKKEIFIKNLENCSLGKFFEYLNNLLEF